jgi:hypothetical protein
LTPTLLPQKFFNAFSYICAQFGHFRHGSDEWENILVRMWRHFLDDVLTNQADERSVRLLPVALLILKAHGKDNPTFETGWIDLTEWAMLAAWKTSERLKNEKVNAAVIQMWGNLYLVELERFYEKYEADLNTEHCLDDLVSASYLQAAAAASLAFWHLGRLGVLNVAYQQLLPHATPEDRAIWSQITSKTTDRIVNMMNANPSCLRPLLDLHHIELYLVWRSLMQQRRTKDIQAWLFSLERALYIRRTGYNPLPFIEGYSNMKLVMEHLLRKEKPYDYCDQSSYLVLMLLEFCCGLPEQEGNELLQLYYRDIVLAVDHEGKPIKESRPLDLMGWSPPEPWFEKLLSQSLRGEGVSLTFTLPDSHRVPPPEKIREGIKKLVEETRAKRPFTYPSTVPVSLVVLACIKNRSPLPMELWRLSIFREPEQTEQPAPAREDRPA